MALSPAGIGVKTNGRSAWLDAPAAAAYRRMLAAGCPPGGITDAGRTNAEQWELYRAYLAGKLKATAAYPGTSKHETGRALDLDDDGPNPRAWVRAHGAEFGWMRDRVKNEPWHMEYEAARDKRAAAPTPVEDDMPLQQSDLEAIDRIVASRIDERLRQGGPWGAVLSQAALERLDVLFAERLDGRLQWLVAELPKHLPAGSGVSVEQVAAAVRDAIDGATATIHTQEA